MTYNFVDEANLDCYRQSLRDKAGQLLRKLFDQLAQGRGRTDAVRVSPRLSSAGSEFGHVITLAPTLAHLTCFSQLHAPCFLGCQAFSKHSNLAYYAHLITREAGPSAVRVDAEHSPWERFFGQQGISEATPTLTSAKLLRRTLEVAEASYGDAGRQCSRGRCTAIHPAGCVCVAAGSLDLCS